MYLIIIINIDTRRILISRHCGILRLAFLIIMMWHKQRGILPLTWSFYLIPSSYFLYLIIQSHTN